MGAGGVTVLPYDYVPYTPFIVFRRHACCVYSVTLLSPLECISWWYSWSNPLETLPRVTLLAVLLLANLTMPIPVWCAMTHTYPPPPTPTPALVPVQNPSQEDAPTAIVWRVTHFTTFNITRGGVPLCVCPHPPPPLPVTFTDLDDY